MTPFQGLTLGTKGLEILSNFAGGASDRKFQKEMYDTDWKRAQHMMKIGHGREDSAIQRRMSDLNKAGLSPTLAVGGPAGSAVMGAPTGKPPVPGGLSKLGDAMSKLGLANTLAQLGVAEAQISKTNAETARITQDTQKFKDWDLPSNQQLPGFAKTLAMMLGYGKKEAGVASNNAGSSNLNSKDTKNPLKKMKQGIIKIFTTPMDELKKEYPDIRR